MLLRALTSATRRAAALALALGCLLAASPAGAQVAPDERWRVFDTEHFRVHYPEGLEPWARRLAARAEVARAQIDRELVRPPRGRMDLVLADNVDYANGVASLFPRPRVVIYAHPPVDDPMLAFYDDWLQVVTTHELVHVHHLDYARGPVFAALRGVFGRVPVAFPNLPVPDWMVEGLATEMESRLTGAGRVRGTMHEMMLRTAVLQDSFFPISQATGDPTSWPAGNTRYVYGSMFLDYLSRRAGPRSHGEFVRIMGGRLVPYLVDRAAKQAYGVSFTQAWAEWGDSLRTRYGALADSLRAAGLTEPEVLTTQGRRTEFPRYSPDGRWIAYAAATGVTQTSTRLLGPDGDVEVIAPRNSTGVTAWMPDGRSLLTTELESVGQYRIFADLYRVGVGGGRERLTRAARLTDPDVARDGRVVAVRNVAGTNELVVMDRPGAEPRVIAEPFPGAHWAAPRWSPDGTRIAAQRRARAGHDVVVLDAAGRTLLEITTDRAVDATPAWSPDGRHVVFASDRTGIFNLYAYEVQGGRLSQVTNVLTGAFQPDVSPDGRGIVFAYHQADGYHLARIPFDPSTWRPAPPVRAEVRGPVPAAVYPDSVGGASRRYSPWPSLLPAGWAPSISRTDDELGTGIGASIGGRDVVERHEYAATVMVFTEGARVGAGAGYLYRGLGNPTLGASLLQDWDVIAEAGTLSGPGGQVIPTALLERDRTAELVATWRLPRFRSFTWLSAGVGVRDRDRVWRRPEQVGTIGPLEPGPEVGAALTLGRSTLRAYDFSIGSQEGWLAAVTAEGRRFTGPLQGETATRGYSRLAGRAQAYRPLHGGGYARSVLAGRLAGGADFGTRAPGYAAGGAGGPGIAFPLGTSLGLGTEPDLPVRGYAAGSQLGDRGVGGTLEYRYPLWRVERGYRVVPVFLDRLWGAVFTDAATAWCVESCDPGLRSPDAPDPLWSAGAEWGVDVGFGYGVPVSFRLGFAVPLRPVDLGPGRRERPGVEGYLLIGRSF